MKHDFTWGVNVENAAHPCVGSPCAHGGSCRPRKEGYECDCPLGFEGLHCQKGTRGAQALFPGAEGMDRLFWLEWGGAGDATLFFFFFFFFLIPPPVEYGSSQARGQIGPAAAGLHHSHSNTGSKLCLRPTLQLTAMPDP